MLFCESFDLVDLRSNLGLTRGILVILVEEGTLGCSNGLCHDILDLLVAPWRDNNIFGFFGGSARKSRVDKI